EGDELLAHDLGRAPGVAAVATLPELPIREAGEEAAVGGEERVGHRGKRLGEPAGERCPGLAAPPAVDVRLRLASAVRGERPGAGGHVPELRVVRIDREGPRVAPVAAVVGGAPRLASVDAERRAAAARLVAATGNRRMPGEAVDVALGAGPVILPAAAAVGGAHKPT